MPKPPTRVLLRWTGGLAFVVRARNHTIVTDGNSETGPSPVELMAAALASCMGTDVAHILAKGRQGLEALDVDILADRAEDNPHRFVRIRVNFDVKGDVQQSQLDRAIQLSHEKYCSVWHSMRQDVPLECTSSIKPR
jgi:putative redox protein